MNRSSNSRSSMFLMEMMVAILFFSLVSAVCLRMFTKSHQISEDTRNLNMAMHQIQNAAELLKYSVSHEGQNADAAETVFPNQLFNAYPNTMEEAGEIAIYFDADWNHCPADNAVFCMIVSQTEDGPLVTYEIQMLDASGEEIDSLSLKLHQPNRP